MVTQGRTRLIAVDSFEFSWRESSRLHRMFCNLTDLQVKNQIVYNTRNPRLLSSTSWSMISDERKKCLIAITLQSLPHKHRSRTKLLLLSWQFTRYYKWLDLNEFWLMSEGWISLQNLVNLGMHHRSTKTAAMGLESVEFEALFKATLAHLHCWNWPVFGGTMAK